MKEFTAMADSRTFVVTYSPADVPA